jgi:hypothetical protein
MPAIEDDIRAETPAGPKVKDCFLWAPPATPNPGQLTPRHRACG